ncbi:hypothetical protein EC973_007894 [Apophysomyces ossiformis]|uniref:UspA domain-containing protein n=1 Tax=Apophysomyces ossiformis TaxID=679940 RepID=A0A8H7BLQ6_9FUNG|nr:hypothetical protein EC973_007894 [Apophysomyces ossiformis]
MNDSVIPSLRKRVDPSIASTNHHQRQLAFREPNGDDGHNGHSPPIVSPNQQHRPRRHSILSTSGTRDDRLALYSDYNTYHRRVSFDNIANLPRAAQSFTLKHKSKGFKKHHNARTFLVAVDLREGTIDPIQFVVHSLMDDGDELIVVCACTDRDCNKEKWTFTTTSCRQKANEIMNHVITIHRRDDKISIVIELVFAKPETALQNMIDLYQPSLVVLGNRAKLSPFAHVFSGTGIFKSALKHTRTPVLLVREHPSTLRRLSANSDPLDTFSSEDKWSDSLTTVPSTSGPGSSPMTAPEHNATTTFPTAATTTTHSSTLASCFSSIRSSVLHFTKSILLPCFNQ